MNAEFFEAIEDIEKEKGIPKEYMLEKINQALLAALKKDNPAAAEAVRVVVDEDKKQIDMFIQKTVVEEVEEPAVQLTVEEARKTSTAQTSSARRLAWTATASRTRWRSATARCATRWTCRTRWRSARTRWRAWAAWARRTTRRG